MKLKHPELPDVEIEVSERAAEVHKRSGWTEVPEKQQHRKHQSEEPSPDDEIKEA